jgi:nitrogen fixation protein FixH
MKYVITLLAALSLMLAACGQSSADNPAPTDAQMSMRAEEPLTVGETTLIVTLTDSSGAPLDGATLSVHGDMDHEGMVAVNREVSDSVNGEYHVPFEWTMGGGWIVTVTARLPENGGELTGTFEYFVEAVSSESIINQHGGMDRHDADAPATIAYEPDRDPAVGGDATVTITLTDADGQPIPDATVEVIGDMDHHGMMPISGTGQHTEEGRYVVPLRWTMAGDWLVTVTATLADGRAVEQTFDQVVVMSAD